VFTSLPSLTHLESKHGLHYDCHFIRTLNANRMLVPVLHKLQSLPEPATSPFPISFAARPHMRGC
jgi:hypothetical protein